MSMPKIGRKAVLKLIESCSSIIATNEELEDFIKENVIRFKLPVYQRSDFETAFSKAEEILSTSEKLGINIVSFQDEQYPRLLSTIRYFPVLLNFKGDIDSLNNNPCVAIVGTKNPTKFGYKFGFHLGEFFASNGFNVVSGLALGCDTVAHRGTFSGNGTTTAVLAHGLDMIYPKENQELSDEILEHGGILVSEYFAGQKPFPNYFIARDRIQAGLSLGVIVVETEVKAGTMHTVKSCIKNNRILATLNHPSKYHSNPKSQGNQLLISEGKAIPIYEKEEIQRLMEKLKLYVFKRE